MDKLIVKKIEQYIYDNIDQNISTKEICSHLNISLSTLFDLFKKETGYTPHKFILNIKIDKAKELLSKGEDICDVALEIGFYDQSHLNRVFKRYESITPYEYKKIMMKGNIENRP